MAKTATTKKPKTKKTTTTTEVVNTPKRKYKKKKQVTLLSEVLNPARAKTTFSYLMSGGIGFYAGDRLQAMMTNQNAGNKALILFAIAFGVGNYMDLKAVSAGIAGAGVRQLVLQSQQAQGLSEEAQYVKAGTMGQLAEKPAFLSAANNNQPYDIYSGLPFGTL